MHRCVLNNEAIGLTYVVCWLAYQEVDQVEVCGIYAELGTRYLKSSAAAAIWQIKQRGTAVYRFLNENVASLLVLAYKTMGAAACRCRYF